MGTTLKDFSALDIFQIVYPGTHIQAVLDIQNQIDDASAWLEQPRDNEKEKLSEKEIFDLNQEIELKTKYVKALLEHYASYTHPSKEMHALCKFYEIKTFADAG